MRQAGTQYEAFHAKFQVRFCTPMTNSSFLSVQKHTEVTYTINKTNVFEEGLRCSGSPLQFVVQSVSSRVSSDMLAC